MTKIEITTYDTTERGRDAPRARYRLRIKKDGGDWQVKGWSDGG